MTEFQNRSFSVYPGKDGGQAYRDNWDRIYAKKADPEADLCTCGSEQFEADGHHDDCPVMTTVTTT